MSANSFGHLFKIHTFGESHGTALGVVIDGCPSGVPFDLELLKSELSRRRPGSNLVTSQRNEADEPEILSGVFENKTLGTPIAIIVRNQNAKSGDYSDIKETPRIGHADDTWKDKFQVTDYRGGGRSSGRETVARVMAGAVAQMFVKLMYPEIKLVTYAKQIGHFSLDTDEINMAIEKNNVETFTTRFPSKREDKVIEALRVAQSQGESLGGVAELNVLNVPRGLGQPIFHKFKSDMGQAIMSIGAVNGVEFGEGFKSSLTKGTDFHMQHDSQKYGGIRGGITTGERINFSTSFKPTSSIKDVAKKGRHDPCIVIRAIPVIESMTWLVLADHILWTRLDNVQF